MKPHSGNKFKVIGVMSGTSLDGLDLVACEFEMNKGKWNFSMVSAETLQYDNEWRQKLKDAPLLSGEKLMELHAEYGCFIGNQINAFIKDTDFIPEIISSHGHTVFHQPENHFTFQLGNGANISTASGITTIADFRTQDIAYGGQGAPLVPVGDRYLFSEFENCLNLGGFANISFEKNDKRIAYDICPVNIVLNYFAEQQGYLFDKNGDLGKRGNINIEFLKELNQIDYYKQKPPKSLSREWLENFFFPVIHRYNINENDKLRTIYEHISLQISASVSKNGKMLITGGGAYNTLLIELIKENTDAEVVIPSSEIINYKEALIFAFLGVLKIKGEINCLSSVTGASKDSNSGVVFTP